VQAYSFTSAPIARSLVEAKKRGVTVIAVLDKTNDKGAKYSSAKFLFDAGIPVYIDYKPAIAHSKVLIIDGTTVITGSFNFTKSAEEKNVENLLILTMDGIDVDYVVALDKITGATIWKTDRSTKWDDIDAKGHAVGDGDFHKAYSTPLIFEMAGRTQMMSPAAKMARPMASWPPPRPTARTRASSPNRSSPSSTSPPSRSPTSIASAPTSRTAWANCQGNSGPPSLIKNCKA